LILVFDKQIFYITLTLILVFDEVGFESGSLSVHVSMGHSFDLLVLLGELTYLLVIWVVDVFNGDLFRAINIFVSLVPLFSRLRLDRVRLAVFAC